MSQSSDFDPDKLYLTKAQILSIGDKLKARWRQNEQANRKMIWIATAAQFLIKRYSDKEIETYYKDFWKEAYEIMQQNALQGDPALKMLQQVSELRPEQTKTTSEKKPLDFVKLLTAGGMPE